METTKYPLYYRKNGRALKRISDLNGQEVRIPDNIVSDLLPLMLSDVTYPDKDRFDEEVNKMEEVDLSCYEDYVYGFISKANVISQAMTARAIKKHMTEFNITTKP